MVTRSRLSTSSRGASSEKGGLLDSSSKQFSTKRTPSSKSKDLAVTQKSMHSALKQALQGRFSKAIPNQSMHIDTEPNSPMSDW